jgi:hypothetical protein
VHFCVGDKVCAGLRIGTVTDVGTVLIRVKTHTGCSQWFVRGNS